MNFCSNCGERLTDGAAFCAACGHPVAAAPPPGARTLPPPADPGTGAAAPIAPIDLTGVLSRVLTGNWTGALATAAATLGSALLLGLLGSFLLLSDHGAIGSGIWGGFDIGLAGLGVPLDLNDSSDKLNQFGVPLTITFAAYLVGSAVFLRTIRGYPSRAAALADAGRCAAVLGALVAVLTIVLKIVDPALVAFGDEGPQLGNPLWLSGYADGRFHATPDVAGAIFIPALLLLTLLTAALFRRQWHGETGRLAQVHDWVSPALHGLRGLTWALVPVGLVPIVSAATIDEADNSLRAWVERLLALPNRGIEAAGAGVGAPIGSRGTGFGDTTYRLGGLADELNWVMWLCIPAALAAVAFAALIVVRWTRADNALRCSAVYLGAFVGVMALFGVFANLSVGGTEDESAETFRLGVDGTELTFTLWAISIAIVAVALLVTGRLRLGHLQARPGEAPPAAPPTAG